MHDAPTGRSPSDEPPGGDGQRPLSGREIVFVLAVVALAVVGGYFFILKMIEVSQQDDCFLARRRNCAPAEPFGR